MSFQCTYCHINFEDVQVCHRVKSLYIDDPVLITLCECCHRNYMKLKQKQEEDARVDNDICHNEKCQTKRVDGYKYCKECLSGIRQVIKIINQTEVTFRNELHNCNEKYGTKYYIIYPDWNLRW